MQEINKFWRLWLKNAAPRNSYIAYYLQKIKLKDRVSKIDETNFTDHRVGDYENLKMITMDQGDVKYKEQNKRSRRWLDKRMSITLSMLQSVGRSLISSKERFAPIRFRSTSIISRDRYEKENKQCNNACSLIKMIIPKAKSTKVLVDYNILFLNALTRLKKWKS